MKVKAMSIVIGALGTIPCELVKRLCRIGNKRKIRDHPEYSIIKIDQNIENIPWYRKRLALIQTLVKNHQIMLM